ncbi:Bug family tripartite tricarboxylate transporter substrate binding protein [Massilia soli]|uniref:Tripartite tricarboxylate transporter substrate binding protein n=1 Tax=Massilia soli TaxID=2792854 RepID=A0ABS7ST84_9BURK|nr:tripartite tricarboxylate transporter substrate binding protein [Massilia soli]MBZ2209163.1 tripartite tricarboxylate transporter substrate binding protein [Massilia soli]
MNKAFKKIDKTRRAVVRSAGAALAFALASTVAAPSLAHAAYPDRPIKFIVPYSPGGLGDSFARLVAQGLSERLGQAVIVENMPGASQAIGAAAAAKAAPDGYTLFMGTQSGLVLNPIAQKKVPFDPVKDFAPVSMLFSSPLFLVVHPSVAAKTVPELIALAKSRPDELTVATIGDGTSTNLGALMFQKRAGVKFMHVPYKGSAPAITDVLAGRVDVFFEGGASALPYVRQGKLRALASTAEERTEKAAPGLPTLKESFPGLSLEVWFGIVAPAGTPKPVIDLLNKEIKAVQTSARIHELAANLGADVVPSTPEELGERIRKELVEYTTIMRAAK